MLEMVEEATLPGPLRFTRVLEVEVHIFAVGLEDEDQRPEDEHEGTGRESVDFEDRLKMLEILADWFEVWYGWVVICAFACGLVLKWRGVEAECGCDVSGYLTS